MKFTRKLRGTYEFNGVVDVTDPGYDRDTFDVLNGIEIIKGKYKCISYMAGKQTGIAQICLERHNSPRQGVKRTLLGYAGVDAGLCGFYQNKPDYNQKEWNEWVDDFYKGKGSHNFKIDDYGFCTDSGHGDGDYPVYAYECKDGIYCVEIIFM